MPKKYSVFMNRLNDLIAKARKTGKPVRFSPGIYVAIGKRNLAWVISRRWNKWEAQRFRRDGWPSSRVIFPCKTMRETLAKIKQ
jgi:hypothetical protein